METLVAVIAVWISTNFGFPNTLPHPTIEFNEPAELTELWIGYTAEHEDVDIELLKRESKLLEIVAFYNSKRKTIHLLQSWHPSDARDVSVLVHEMVHHLQFGSGATFACPAEREKAAYAAQNAWLAQFQTSLQTAFEIDPMTLLISTKCMY